MRVAGLESLPFTYGFTAIAVIVYVPGIVIALLDQPPRFRRGTGLESYGIAEAVHRGRLNGFRGYSASRCFYMAGQPPRYSASDSAV